MNDLQDYANELQKAQQNYHYLEDVAKIAGASESALYMLLRRKHLTYYKVRSEEGRKRIAVEEAVAKWLINKAKGVEVVNPKTSISGD